MTDYTVGNSIVATAYAWGQSPSQLQAVKFTANDPSFPASHMAVQIAEINGGSTIRLGIYADNAGSPGSLLGQTADISVTGTSQWQSASLTSNVSIVSGQDYWLALHSPNFTDIMAASQLNYTYSTSTIIYDPTGLPATHGGAPISPGGTGWAIYAVGVGPDPTAFAIDGTATGIQPYKQIWRNYRLGHNHAKRELLSGNWMVELTFEPAQINLTREWTEAASSGSHNLNILNQYKTDWTTLSGVYMEVTQEPETRSGHAGEMIIVVRGASIRA